ncbi:MAG TPA: DUF6776 family protein [Steroidobacteraceae bacterium]|nr:DUF6776 family protein [Steroidobacteraceae bacterium]
MAKYSPLHTGQFVIKPRARKRRRLVNALLVLLLILVPYVTFEAGRYVSGYSIVSSAHARFKELQRIHALQTTNDELQRKLNSTQIGQTVDQQSTMTLQKTLSELQDQLQEQRAELAFYQSIVTPPVGTSTEPQVQRVEIEAEGASKYLLRLVLIQVMRAGGAQQVQGSVQVEVIGTQQNGTPLTLPLPKLTTPAMSELKFNYRYFQTVEQTIELPAGFQPTTVNVEMNASQHAPQHQSFGWQLLSASDVTHHVQSS